ncbi:hypothetical protein [uncultured Chryseobacterium sp.]|uniref:hypothetical protein n=1 Tax=uncultured Chryseobacterium sp. TaxID=259322 RepID=UPI0025F02301|nr:hypothetical protein [uncultured Chryseobacterium sp.]
MKNIIFSLFTLFLAASCGREIIEYRTINTYSYINESSADMDLYSYRQGQKTKHEIGKGNTYSQELDLNSGSVENVIFYADSVKIVYGQNRFKVWKATDNNSLMREENYQKTAEKENDQELQFIFTTQDAAQTLPCNGNCN